MGLGHERWIEREGICEEIIDDIEIRPVFWCGVEHVNLLSAPVADASGSETDAPDWQVR
jgi:hypothetical protein